jgi:hypothetical protein
MKTYLLTIGLALAAAQVASPGAAQAADDSRPHLETRHGARQLVVDGKPFLMTAGELHNSSTSSLEYMKPFWPQLAQKNLNTVLAVITWETIEPQEGKFDFTTVDDTIAGARQNHLRLVILWFGSWKNGESSYQPSWVKADPKRFPWAKDRAGRTLNIISTFGDATRDGDAKACAALMKHIRQVDGTQHTVLAMQVENEVGLLGDSRDHVAAANAAFAGPVPKELLNYLVKHKDTLGPELRQVWATNGYKTSGTWTEVFGQGKPEFVVPLSELSQQEYQTLWRQFNWPVDEIFMAWRYASYINKVAAAGKAEYDIPMYCNTWLQQDREARPGEFPSGCPEPEVHDIWRCFAPSIDILAPDIYIPYFDEVCQRFTRNGNPLFIPEASGSPANALLAYFKYNAICYSPFGIEGRSGGGGRRAAAASDTTAAPPQDPLAATYAILNYLAPVILDNQGKGTIVMLRPTNVTDPGNDTNPQTEKLKLGDYTLNITFAAGSVGNGTGGGGRRGGAGARGGGGARGAGAGGGGGGGGGAANAAPNWFVINSGPGEYWFVGGPMSVTFTANAPEKGSVVLGSFDETLNVDGRWVAGRRLNGDETSNNKNWPGMGTFGIYRYSVFQRP